MFGHSPAMKPLSGHCVMVTRRPDQAGDLTRLLQLSGAEVQHLPLLSIAPPLDGLAFTQACAHLDRMDWVVFASRNAVEQTVKEWNGPWPAVAAIGSGTAQACREAGLEVALVPGQQDADGLVRELATRLRPHDKVMLPQAENARPRLAEGLLATGAQVQVAIAYRSLPPPEPLHLPGARVPDLVTFASSATVKRFFTHVRADAVAQVRQSGAGSIAIGPQTAATLEKVGWAPVSVAAQPDIPSLVAACIAALS